MNDDVVEHGEAGLVGEGEAVDLEAGAGASAGAPRLVAGDDGVAGVGRLVEHPLDAVVADDGARQLAEHVADEPQREHEHLEQADEGDDGADA